MLPEWAVAIISIAGSAFISTFIGFLLKRSLNKYFEKKDAVEKDKAEKLAKLEALEKKQDEEKLLDLIRAVIGEEVLPLEKKLDAVADGTLSSLRNMILTCYYKCVEKGYRNDYDYQNIHHMDDSYTDLNGNSYVADVIKRFDELPTKEQYDAKRKEHKQSKKSTPKKKQVLVEDK